MHKNTWLLIGAVVLAGGVAMYMSLGGVQLPPQSSNSNTSSTDVVAESTTPSNVVSKKKYSNDEYGFSFEYPEEAQFSGVLPYQTSLAWPDQSRISFYIGGATDVASLKKNDNRCSGFKISTQVVDGREVTVRDHSDCDSGDAGSTAQSKASGLSAAIPLSDGKILQIATSEYAKSISETARTRFSELLTSFHFLK